MEATIRVAYSPAEEWWTAQDTNGNTMALITIRSTNRAGRPINTYAVVYNETDASPVGITSPGAALDLYDGPNTDSAEALRVSLLAHLGY